MVRSIHRPRLAPPRPETEGEMRKETGQEARLPSLPERLCCPAAAQDGELFSRVVWESG